jgi:hypothetical protein
LGEQYNHVREEFTKDVKALWVGLELGGVFK